MSKILKIHLKKLEQCHKGRKKGPAAWGREKTVDGKGGMRYDKSAFKTGWYGGTGRRKGLKIPRWRHRIGSIPITSTKEKRHPEGCLFLWCWGFGWEPSAGGRLLALHLPPKSPPFGQLTSQTPAAAVRRCGTGNQRFPPHALFLFQNHYSCRSERTAFAEEKAPGRVLFWCRGRGE